MAYKLNPLLKRGFDLTGGGITTASGAVISINGQDGVVTLTTDEISQGILNKYYPDDDASKLATIEIGAEVNNISDNNALDLTDGNDSSLHYHHSDRNRTTHSGTQTASTISDFDTEVSNNGDVSANTSARHTPETLGTKVIDETDIADAKVIKYNVSTGKLEYEDDNNTTYTSSDFDHNALTNTHNLTTDIDHNQLKNYIIESHRNINDSVTTTSGLWSSNKINTELGGKAPTSHNHTASEITDFDTEVSNNSDVSANASARHTAVSLGVDADTILGLTVQEITLDNQTANYVFAGPISGAVADPAFRALVSDDIPSLTASKISDFDTTVSGNATVTANASLRHSALTVTDSPEIDFTLTGQELTASLKNGSIDEAKLDASVNSSLDLADSAIQSSDLATVATSGAYSDLSGTPSIPTQYTDEMAQDAVGGMIADTATIDLTYTDATPELKADVKDGSITLAKQANLAQNTIIGRISAGAGVPEALTAANVRTIINVADGAEANVNADWNSASGDSQILNKPTLFSGSYTDLTNKPTIPTKVSDLTNDSGYIIASDLPVLSKSISVESPTDSEDISMFFTPVAITVTKMVAVLVGSDTPSVTWTLRHHTDRSNAGNEVVTSGTTTTSTTTGSVVTSFNDATIPANSYVWLESTAQSGTVGSLNLTLIYTED